MMSENLRKEPRIRSRGAVQLWMGDTDPIPGVIQDVSVYGMCVETEIAMPRGIGVRIVGTGFTGEAVIRYCYARGSSFRIGMELVPEAAMAQAAPDACARGDDAAPADGAAIRPDGPGRAFRSA